MTRRRSLVCGLALLVIVGVVAWRYMGAHEREIQAIAGRLMACGADDVVVIDSNVSDTAEVYWVRGCGAEATVICGAPDFECFLQPATSPR